MSKTPSRHTSTSVTAGLPLGLLLGFALLALSYLRLAGYLNTAAFNMPAVVAETLTEPLWKTRLGLNALVFGLTQLIVHLAFGAACWLLAVASGRAWPKAGPSRRQWVFLWFLMATIWLLVANATLFPRSLLGEPYKAIGQLRIFGVSPLLALTTLIGAAAAITLVAALRRTLGTRRLGIVAGAGTALALGTGFLLHAGPAPAVNTAHPNVILLGIDALRPDVVTRANTPNMRAFLDGSLQLTDAVTPLARTFPSWVAILTGRHPHTTGAFMNLLPRNLIHEGHTLPELLREQGYHTVYGIDETRFSNIDTSYGFDKAATPGMGGSDFVLTWFADAPLSNMLVNTRLGGWLFPFQHANRSADVTYEPDSFVHRIDHALDGRQPLFLALHMTLSHWPYDWADSPPPPIDLAKNTEATYRWKYLTAARRADRQFGDILALLERKGLLDNAIVVALSDHGEAFGADDDFLAQAYPGIDPATLKMQESGHGTSVFSPHQFHTVLGFRTFGAATSLLPTPRKIAPPVSLVDVTPTILDLLGVRPAETEDGDSLVPLFRDVPGTPARFEQRIRFTESEYNPNGFSPENPTASAIAQAAMVYRVDPRTDRLQVRSDLIGAILSTRQYAAMLGDSFAAAVPNQTGGNPYRLVYEPGPGSHDPGQEDRLRQALEARFKIRFGNQVTEIKAQP